MIFFFNVLLAAAVGVLAYKASSENYHAALVAFWFAYRLETALSNQVWSAKILKALLATENMKMEAALAQRAEAISEIARNN